jgi:hypothetical protein
MARTRSEDLQTMALNRRKELLEEKGRIYEEIKALEKYLQSLGSLKSGRRGRPTDKGNASGKTSATDAIISAIAKSKEGISIDGIMKDTGLRRLTVNGVLNRMKKTEKVKALKRGIYGQN